jgi:hypothetical protein
MGSPPAAAEVSQPRVAYLRNLFVDEYGALSSRAHAVEHRGVRYEIKIAPGRGQWTWIVHTSPKSRQGSVEGPRRVAILAAEKAINRWWNQRHGLNAARVITGNG